MTATFFKLIVNSIISPYILCNVSGFPTSSASGPSGSGVPTRHSSLFNLYCGEDDESESDHVNGFGVGLGGPSGVGSTGGHHHHPQPPVQATETTFNAAAMPPSVGTLGNTSSTDDDDTSSPGKLKMKLTKKMKNQSAPCVAGC